MPKSDLPLNEAQTHVRTIAPSGVPWECPVGFWPTAKEQGYVLADDDAYGAALDRRAESLAEHAAAEAELIGGGPGATVAATGNDVDPTSTDGTPPPVGSGLFDPNKHTRDEVNEHLALHVGDPAEVQRVLAAEAAGQNRKTVQPPTGD